MSACSLIHRRWPLLLALLPALLLSACAAGSAVSRTNTGSTSGKSAPGLGLTEAGRIRQASNVVLSPAGDRIAFVLGDSLMVAATAPSADSVSPMLVATGVADEASAPVPFLAWSPDERRLLYRSGGVDRGVPMVASLGGAPPRPLLPDSVARRLATFQNSLASGPAWSPDGRRIAFLAVARTDRTYALQVYVADVESGRLERWTGAGRARFSVAWSPNGRWLAYTSGALGGGPGTPPSTVELLYAPTGMARSAMLVASDSASLLRDLRWSPDGTLLLAQDRARRTVVVRITEDSASPGVVDGMRVPHALPRRAFAGWLPGDLLAGAPDGARGRVGSLALLTAVPEGMSARLAAVSFPSGRVTPLTGPDTLATAIGSASGAPRDDAHARGASGSHSVVAYRLETGSLPSDIWVADLSTDAARGGPRLSGAHNVTRANPWLEPQRLPRTRIVRWVSGDPVRHDTLEGQLLEPHGARPTRGWPLVVVPYGDYRNEFPKSEYFLDRGLLPLVAAGYAVVRPNTRGIATDSRDGGEYGRPQLEDTERLLEKLVAEGTVDPRRVAVIGHSHGGAMAYYYLTHATPWRAREARGTSRFCAVVAVNGRADWVLQGNRGDGVLPEGLGGTPAERPEVYRLFSPAANARSAVAPLLAVAGGKDTQILPANVPIMADSMRAAGRKVETLVFPEEGHLLLAEPDVRQFWDRTLALLVTECETR